MKLETIGDTFAVSLTGDECNDPSQVKAMTDMLDKQQEAFHGYVGKLANDLNISIDCACAVAYLRTRSRHTPELEAELIRLHKAGTPPDIYDFGVTAASQDAMTKRLEALVNKYRKDH